MNSGASDLFGWAGSMALNNLFNSGLTFCPHFRLKQEEEEKEQEAKETE